MAKKQRAKIVDYKVVTWMDRETKRSIFGVKVLLADGRWAYVEERRRLVIHYAWTAAQRYIAGMKRARTRAGYKRQTAR